MAKVFLASSTPAKPVMYKIAGWLNERGITPLKWDDPGLFQAGDYILERLLEISYSVDGAVIIFGDEDKEWYHGDTAVPPRDNVLIEYGIFASRLGRERTIVCRTGAPKTASDLGGLIFIQLEKTPKKLADAKLRLTAWADELPELTARAREEAQAREAKATAKLRFGVDQEYRISESQVVRLVTGSVKDVRNIDVLVSSENTFLQPARFFERSMSGMLRYLDAEKDRGGRIRRDAYMISLASVIEKEELQLPVLPGAVLSMPATGLRQQGVKYVFHAATVEGLVEAGYRASPDSVPDAVRNSLQEFTKLAANEPLSSILFPLFAAGGGRMAEDLVADLLVHAIDTGLKDFPIVKEVHLLAYVESHRAALRCAAEKAGWKSTAGAGG